jgi:hypothetical protein
MSAEAYKPQIIIEEDADDMARRVLANLDALIAEDPLNAQDLLTELPSLAAIVQASTGKLYPKYHRDRLIGSLATVWANCYDVYLGFDPHTEAEWSRAMPDRPEMKRFNRLSLYITKLATWTEVEGLPGQLKPPA